MGNKIRKNILFNKERDKDILNWLEAQENQSETVREALCLLMFHKSVSPVEPSLTDVLDELKSLSEQITNIKIVQRSEGLADYQEPSDLVAMLKNFGV